MVTLQTELAGRTTASLSADLRPQVSGIIKARTFEEGARVKAGQVLYAIDPAMYRAVFEEAKANLASAKAALESAKLKDERFASLIKIEGVSQQEADDARAGRELATASVAQRQAALEAARINLAYTAIKAPISGRSEVLVRCGPRTANQPSRCRRFARSIRSTSTSRIERGPPEAACPAAPALCSADHEGS